MFLTGCSRSTWDLLEEKRYGWPTAAERLAANTAWSRSKSMLAGTRYGASAAIEDMVNHPVGSLVVAGGSGWTWIYPSISAVGSISWERSLTAIEPETPLSPFGFPKPTDHLQG
ncbi:hypothetical protein GX48_08305 [Paracoccidioides brasiliensis]|nr:hypothetical protein GX48_08305 [Paracoccidioides brasiliensis]